MRDPKERVLDILEAVAAIERHSGQDRAAFEHDELLQVWFLRHLQIIGEAARTIPGEVQALAPEIPWFPTHPGASSSFNQAGQVTLWYWHEKRYNG